MYLGVLVDYKCNERKEISKKNGKEQQICGKSKYFLSKETKTSLQDHSEINPDVRCRDMGEYRDGK